MEDLVEMYRMLDDMLDGEHTRGLNATVIGNKTSKKKTVWHIVRTGSMFAIDTGDVVLHTNRKGLERFVTRFVAKLERV